MLRGALVVVLMAFVLPSASGYAAGGAKGTPPFKYTYRITHLTVNAEYTAYGSKASSRLRLDGPSKLKWISWFGPNAKGRAGTYISVAALFLTGEASYSSPDPSCASQITYKSSTSHPVRATFQLISFNRVRIRITVRKFPIARAFAGRDSGPATSDYSNRCGSAQVRFYDSAEAVVLSSVLAKPSFVITDSRRESFESHEGIAGANSIDWTLEMMVKRIRYHLIDCATEPGC